MTTRSDSSKNPAVSETSIVAAVKEQASCDLEGEAVILNLKSGLYHGLNPVGARVWELVQEPTKVNAIRDTLTAEYDVDAQTCTRDLLAVLEDMLGAGLIEVHDGGKG